MNYRYYTKYKSLTMCVKRFMHMLYGICRHAVAGVVAHLKKKKKKKAKKPGPE